MSRAGLRMMDGWHLSEGVLGGDIGSRFHGACLDAEQADLPGHPHIIHLAVAAHAASFP